MSRLQEQMVTAFVYLAWSVVFSACGSHRDSDKVPESQVPAESRYEEAARVREAVGRKANTLLKHGMSIDQAVALMGSPLAIDDSVDRILMYDYADSVSGTFAYWVVFKDRRLDNHGVAQTAWVVDHYKDLLLLEFSRKVCASIRPGMTESQVLELLGNPKEKQILSEGVQCWRYMEGALLKSVCIVMRNGQVDYFGALDVPWLEDFYDSSEKWGDGEMR